MELVKFPVPDPSVVWLAVISGFVVVDQQTPRAITEALPSEVTVPPEDAVVEVMEVGVVVETIGKVVNCKSVPYAVPSAIESVAYALI
jgi:hypothetical protein